MNKKPRLETMYLEKIRPELKKALGIENVMALPKLEKIVINIGSKDAVADSRVLKTVVEIVRRITGQNPVKTLARKSIAGFKLREGMPIGVMVTLRRRAMYEFLDKLINLSLPQVRDFQGVTNNFDGRGNYNLGIKDWTIFPEVEYGSYDKVRGMNITIHTSAKVDKNGHELLRQFGMPFTGVERIAKSV